MASKSRLLWLREFWSLTRPFWTSERRWRAALYLFFIIVITLTCIYLTVRLNKWYQQFYDLAASAKGATDYYHFLLQFCWLAAIYLTIARMSSYLRYRLRLDWRESMTRHFLSLWLLNQNHYFCKLTQKTADNPDQRIAEDIQIFVDNSLKLTLDLFDRVVTLLTFIGVLWGLSGSVSLPAIGGISLTIPGYLVYASIGFAIASNFLIYFIGRQLISLQYEQQHREADFRYALVRIRDNTESIALAQGESAELINTDHLFSRIVSNFRSLIRKFIQVEFFEAGHGQIKTIFPWFVAAPRLLSGAIKVGGLMQIANAFNQVESSISFLVSSFEGITIWRSAVKRLSDLQSHLHQSTQIREDTQSKLIRKDTQTSLRANHIHLLTPDQRTLIDQLTFEIKVQERIMFKGPSGTGKSTLFRAMAGIWPFFGGTFEVPKLTDSMFLSQSPYMPQGTLKQALLYPHYKNEKEISDQTLEQLLVEFHLQHLKPRLNSEEDWQQSLSPGEKQRVVLIRATIRQPQWLFLDEATSALDEKNHQLAYTEIRRRLPKTTIVSISHREGPDSFHTRTLELKKATA